MLAKTEIIHNLLGEDDDYLSNKDAGSGSGLCCQVIWATATTCVSLCCLRNLFTKAATTLLTQVQSMVVG